MAEGLRSPVLIPRGILFDRHCGELQCVCVCARICVFEFILSPRPTNEQLFLRAPDIPCHSIFKTDTTPTQSVTDLMSYTHQLPVWLRVKCSTLSCQSVMGVPSPSPTPAWCEAFRSGVCVRICIWLISVCSFFPLPSQVITWHTTA